LDYKPQQITVPWNSSCNSFCLALAVPWVLLGPTGPTGPTLPPGPTQRLGWLGSSTTTRTAISGAGTRPAVEVPLDSGTPSYSSTNSLLLLCSVLGCDLQGPRADRKEITDCHPRCSVAVESRICVRGKLHYTCLDLVTMQHAIISQFISWKTVRLFLISNHVQFIYNYIFIYVLIKVF
jgi:hypothetical protein